MTITNVILPKIEEVQCIIDLGLKSRFSIFYTSFKKSFLKLLDSVV